MLELTEYSFIRAINPNVGAGERSLSCTPAAWSGGLYVIQPNTPFYNFGNGQFTIYFRVLWLGQEAFDGGSNNVSIANRASNGTGWNVVLQGDPGSTVTNPLRLTMGFYSGGQPCIVSANSGWPLDGKFHYGVIVRRTDTAAAALDTNNIKLYVDGIEITTAVTGTMVNFDSNNDMFIGGVGARKFRGYIDCLSFYNRGLSDAEIKNLDTTDLRTDDGARFIQDFNQVSGDILYDSTSVGSNGTAEMTPIYAAGRAYVRNDGIRTFRKNSVLTAPLNGDFVPTARTVVTGIARFDAELTQAEFSLDGINWGAVNFDSTGLSQNFPATVLGPDLANTTLYLRATNTSVSFLNALELIY